MSNLNETTKNEEKKYLTTNKYRGRLANMVWVFFPFFIILILKKNKKTFRKNYLKLSVGF